MKCEYCRDRFVTMPYTHDGLLFHSEECMLQFIRVINDDDDQFFNLSDDD